MVFALPENEGSARCGARASDSVLSPALGKGLRAMAGKHSGLVHQPPDLVGAPDTGMVPQAEVRGRRSEVGGLCRIRAAGGRGELGTGPGHARYLVLVLALGL